MPPRPDVPDLPPHEHARLAHEVMRRQASLSVKVAALFIVLLFGIPLVNFYLPEIANAQALGFTASWLFLGLLFYPITWLLSAYFIRESNRIENECMDWRAVLGMEAGEPLEPEGLREVKPAFIQDEFKVQGSKFKVQSADTPNLEHETLNLEPESDEEASR